MCHKVACFQVHGRLKLVLLLQRRGPRRFAKLLDGFSRYYAGQTIAVHEAGRSKTMDLQRHHAAEEHS